MEKMNIHLVNLLYYIKKKLGWIYSFLLRRLVWLFCILVSCHKAGEGGKSSITATIKHNSKQIPFAQVYIKYDATEFPGTDMAVYEDNNIANASGVITFDTLYKGDYYLYAIGYDTVANTNVYGGVYVKLKSKEDRAADVIVN